MTNENESKRIEIQQIVVECKSKSETTFSSTRINIFLDPNLPMDVDDDYLKRLMEGSLPPPASYDPHAVAVDGPASSHPLPRIGDAKKRAGTLVPVEHHEPELKLFKKRNGKETLPPPDE